MYVCVCVCMCVCMYVCVYLGHIWLNNIDIFYLHIFVFFLSNRCIDLIINYRRFINQFPPDTIKSMRSLARINTKICGQRISISFNQIYINIYIVIHRQTVSLYPNSSVWLDTPDASNSDCNPPNFMLDIVSYRSAISRHMSARDL